VCFFCVTKKILLHGCFLHFAPKQISTDAAPDAAFAVNDYNNAACPVLVIEGKLSEMTKEVGGGSWSG
jgi:hypothetical protein